jgi:[acyl-carrier-protein] S-malonyltransferase
MITALLFPGQGSQAVGMGKELAERFREARAVFDEVDAALNQHLSRLIFEGPEAELTLTSNTQPALLAVSLAALKSLEAATGFDLGRDAAYVAGHSLGEYSALAAAGSLSLGDAARLLRLRGEAMQRAVPVGEGAMAAILGLDLEAVEAAASEGAEGEVCEVANDNGGGQVVISGHRAAVDRAMLAAKARGAKRCVLLPVSAPFHCALMRPAADAMAAALGKVAMAAPRVPIIANVIARPLVEPDEIRRRLVEQVAGTVRWRESLLYMGERGITRFIEVGPGKILSGLVKRVVPSAVAAQLGTPRDIEALEAA